MFSKLKLRYWNFEFFVSYFILQFNIKITNLLNIYRRRVTNYAKISLSILKRLFITQYLF
jgi:hypothetical protein